jgi:hypothetical protein
MIERVERIERALLLLANHVGAVGWNYELQKALDAVRYPDLATEEHALHELPHEQQHQRDAAEQ